MTRSQAAPESSQNGSATTFDAFTYRVQNPLGSNSTPATVTLTITNALRLAAPTLALPPSAPPASYQFVEAFPGLVFEDAMAIATPVGRTNQIFVVERRGRISYVPDINAATERIKANGGQILNGPMEVPGGDWIVNAMDPQGAAFSLHAVKAR